MKTKRLFILAFIALSFLLSQTAYAEEEQPTSGFNVYISSTMLNFKNWVVWYNPEWSDFFMTVAANYDNDIQRIVQFFWFEGNWSSQMEWYLLCSTPAFDITDLFKPNFLPEVPAAYIEETNVNPYMACYKSGSIHAFLQVRSTTVKSLAPNPAEYHTYVPLNLGTDVWFGQ